MADEKQSLEEKLKDKAKGAEKREITKLKIKVIKVTIPIIVYTICALMLASAVYAIISSVLDLIKGLGQSIANTFSVSDNGIEITDDQLDQIIKAIEDSGIDFDDLGILRRGR